jgi:anti-anti-sigma factor
MTPRPFSYELSADGRTLTLHGELDEVATLELRELLRSQEVGQVDQLDLELTDVDFLPSVAVGVLASARAAAAGRDASITFVAAPSSISHRVLTICGLPCEEPA